MIVKANQTVYLDGSGSYDPEGDSLTYLWSVISSPGGAQAQISNVNITSPAFTATLIGSYILQLSVSDGVNAAVADSVRVEVVNQQPVTDAGDDKKIYLGQDVTLDASASYDADNDELGYEWELVSQPSESNFVLSVADKVAESFTFTPDVLGLYQFSLTVNDGIVYGETAQVTVYVNKKITILDYQVIDAEYSKSLNKIIMVATAPNRLFVYDPVTNNQTEVDLPLVPNNVSVSPDGLFAAVGHNAWVSYVDLSAGVLNKTLAVSCDASDTVLAGNGYIYISPTEDQWERLRAINIATGEESQHTGDLIYDKTKIKLHPAGLVIYGANNGLSPSDLEKYAITGAVPEYLYDSPYHGDYDFCGDLWMSEDGLRIFTRCGNVFRSSAVRNQDMIYNGSLDQLTGIQHLSHSSASGKVVVIPRDNYWWYEDEGDTGDTELQIYDYQYLAFEKRLPLSNFIVADKGYQAHGRFVFHSADGSQYFVIVQADEESGMLKDYGVITY
ncbi:MAG: REJ domain-containing protein [Thiolinea sp.]